MSKNSFILIGYRGTGKTTIARELGVRLGIPAFDSDPEIEARTGKTIAEIFAREGEPVFRDHEAAVITELLKKSPIVLATGGGVILRAETRTLLRKSGTVIWLTAKPETILARMTGDSTTATRRPNLTNLPPLDEIVSLLAKRDPFYRETAYRIIATDDKSVDEIVREILVDR